MQKSLIQELLKRRVPYILGSYIVASTSMILFIEWLCVRFYLPDYYVSISLFCLLSIIPSVILIAYFHGAPGKDEWTKIEKYGILINVLFVALILFISFHFDYWNSKGINNIGDYHNISELEQVTFRGTTGLACISPDGKYFAYSTNENNSFSGRKSVFVADKNNSNNVIKLMTLDNNDFIHRIWWSSNSEQVLVAVYSQNRDMKTLLINKLGGAIQQLPYFTTCSPDLKLGTSGFLAHKEIYIRELENNNIIDTIKIIGDYTWLMSVKWSPKDKNLLLCITAKDDIYSIWTISINNKKKTLLYETSTINNLFWSPNGDACYYLLDNNGLGYALCKFISLGRLDECEAPIDDGPVNLMAISF